MSGDEATRNGGLRYWAMRRAKKKKREAGVSGSGSKSKPESVNRAAKTPVVQPETEAAGKPVAKTHENPTTKLAVEVRTKLGFQPKAESGAKYPTGHTKEPLVEAEGKPTNNPGYKPRTNSECQSAEARFNNDEFDVVVAWRAYWGQGALADWQRLCRDLGVKRDVSSQQRCKEALADIHVNIHDFLRTCDKLAVVHFPTRHALAEYTRATKKVYPKRKVEEGSPLGLLMIRFNRQDRGRKHAEERRGKENQKQHTGLSKYAFVAPPETYERRRKGQRTGV